MSTARSVFWLAAGALAWTHVGYPVAAAALARARPRPVRRRDGTPAVTVVVAAHNEEDVIGARLENLLALDYPADRMDVIVASDGSTDGTDAAVEAVAAREPRVRLLSLPRGGKVAAQDVAVASAQGEILAFSDANSIWESDALAVLARNFADSDVGYVCGQVRLVQEGGTSRELLYWRYEMWLRESESSLAGVTGGNGAIYAVRREDYVDGDPRFGHDLGFPYLMAQRGRRAIYDPEALATEKAPPDSEDEYNRKERMLAQCWLHLLSGRMLRPAEPLFLVQIVSHRVLRYSSGFLHLALLGSSAALARERPVYRAALAGQLAFLGLAAAGRARLPLPGASVAWHYAVVTSATISGLVRLLRRGVPAVWDRSAAAR